MSDAYLDKAFDGIWVSIYFYTLFGFDIFNYGTVLMIRYRANHHKSFLNF